MEYLSKKEVRPYRQQFDDIIIDLKEVLGNEWKFQYYLVGSAKRNLVLDNNEGFDLDYHIKLNKWPDSLSDEEIKRTFKDKLDKILPNYDLSPCEDSTHVLTTKYIEEKQKIYSYDIAIIKEGINSQILKNEKENGSNGPYHFVDIPDGSSFYERYKLIRESQMWNDLRNNYKDKKIEQHKIKKEYRALSFSLLISAVNEVLQSYHLI